MKDRVTTTIISLQMCLNHLESVKHLKIFQRELKQRINLLLPELIKCENKYFDLFFNKEEETTAEIYKVYEMYIDAISSVEIYDMENIVHIINAYKKDKKSIEGIVNKILR